MHFVLVDSGGGSSSSSSYDGGKTKSIPSSTYKAVELELEFDYKEDCTDVVLANWKTDLFYSETVT